MQQIRIYLDMDGTIANLYAVENWKQKLDAHDASPYAEAAPMCNFASLARSINAARAKGIAIGIISWLAKNTTDEYNAAVTAAKVAWLKQHLPSVQFDELHIVPYGTPKSSVAAGGILVDDEPRNRAEWVKSGGVAVAAENLIDLFKII